MKVAIFYHFFPHYRAGVIKAIAKRTEFSKVDFYGHQEKIEGIPAFNDENVSIRNTKNIWLGKQLVQPQVLREAFFPQYDAYVFLANPNFISTWIAAVILKLRGRRVIFWGHGFFSSERTARNMLRVMFFKLSSAHYLYGHRAKVCATELGFKPENLYVGFNSLDYDHQLKIRRSIEYQKIGNKACDSNQLHVLAISRLTPICQYDLLLEAAHLLTSRTSLKIIFTFVGDGPELARLKEIAEQYKLNANFLGAIYDEERTAKIISEADCVAQPGKLGLTAMHALMYGTPVITHSDFSTQMPEVEAVAEGITGIFHAKNSIESIAEALQKFKNTFTSREETRRNCWAVIDKIYNPQKQADVLADAVRGKPAQIGNDMQLMFKKA